MANILLVDTISGTLALRTSKETFSCPLGGTAQTSEELIPLISSLLEKAKITVADLTYTVTTSGPGSFTSLRLAFAALKAFTLAQDIPMRAVPTLDAYLESAKSADKIKVAVLDAHAGKFFLKIADNSGKVLLETGLYSSEVLRDFSKEKTVLCGPDAAKVQSYFQNATIDDGKNLLDAIFNLSQNAPEQKDYDAPLYFQASSAEEKLKSAGE